MKKACRQLRRVPFGDRSKIISSGFFLDPTLKHLIPSFPIFATELRKKEPRTDLQLLYSPGTQTLATARFKCNFLPFLSPAPELCCRPACCPGLPKQRGSSVSQRSFGSLRISPRKDRVLQNSEKKSPWHLLSKRSIRSIKRSPAKSCETQLRWKFRCKWNYIRRI